VIGFKQPIYIYQIIDTIIEWILPNIPGKDLIEYYRKLRSESNSKSDETNFMKLNNYHETIRNHAE